MVSRRGRREAGAGSRALPGPRGSWGVVTREGELQPPPAQVSCERFCGEGGGAGVGDPGGRLLEAWGRGQEAAIARLGGRGRGLLA